MRETGFGIKKLLETMSSQEENESYMTEFTRDKLREMLKTGEKLPTSFSEKKLSPIMEDTFSKPFKNMIGDIKTKSLQSTKNIFQTLLQEKFNSQRFIKVKFSDKLKKISHNTHELYKKLGIKDKIPDDMPLDCIESIRLIDPKFLLFFLETGTATNFSQPSLFIETNIDWLNIGYKSSELDPLIDYEIQSDMIADYYISIIQSFVLIQKLVGSHEKPLQTLRTWGKIRIGAWGEKFNLKQKVDVLITSILKVEQFLGQDVGEFLFEKVMNFQLLNKRGMDLELVNWLKKNWRNIPYTNSYEETQFFYKWKEIESTYPNNLINNTNTKFEVTKFAQSIIEMGNLLHIDRFFPHNPIKEPIGTDANVMNNIVSKILSDFIPSEFTPLFSQISLFSTTNFHDIRHRIDTKPTSIQIYKLFIYEYLKQVVTNLIYQGNTSEFTELNQDLWNAQQSGLVESPIFSEKYLSKYDFSGNLWLDEYFAHSRSKIHLYKKTKSLMSFLFLSIDENGVNGSFTTKGHPAESHLFRITTKYKDETGNLIETIQNMLFDTWFYTSLNYQNDAGMRFVRDAIDIIISHKNERTDFKKDVYLDGILFLGFLFGLDALLPISQERAGIKKFDYFMSKMFDALGVREKYHPFSETLVINEKIAPNQIKKFNPGTLTPYITTTEKLVQLELFKLLPPKHFNDNGTWTNGYYDKGIPLGTSYKDLYRDAMMCGNAHIFDRLPNSILKQISSKGITATDGNFGVIFDYEVAQFYYQAKLIAGRRYATGLIPHYNSLKDFIYSLKNLNFEGSYEERLGLPSIEMAQKIFTAFGLNWTCANIKDEDSLYLWPEAKKLWNDIKFQNTYKYGGYDNLWAKIAFFGIFQRISQTSKQIHLLFNPNEFFSDKNKLWQNDEGIYDKNLMENELSRYLETKLARWENVKGNNRLFWNYPGDPSKQFNNYKYFSVLYLNDILNGDFKKSLSTSKKKKPKSKKNKDKNKKEEDEQ